jgi:serralysin
MSEPKKNERHFCSLVLPKSALGRSKAALLNDFKWQPGTRIRVRFLDGAPELRARVQAVAEEWTGPAMANLRFQFLDDSDAGDADIRIAFVQGDGSWSYLGTMSQQIPASEQTMNYGWLTPDSDDDELHRVVTHEFGHALGLIHEHQNPEKPISWNRDAVIADLSGPPNNWDPETIENNIFKRYDQTEVATTPTDPDSIMMYPIPAAWTTDGFSVDLNTNLSETDRRFIAEAYPW